MRKQSLMILCSLVLLTATPQANAAPWVVDAARSRLTFTGEQTGEVFHGEFKKFTPVIEFDPAHPERATITVTIDMASATIEGKDRADALPTADWFAVSAFPTATFMARSINATGKDASGISNYRANGTITIRGLSRAVELPFSLKTEGSSGVARGEVTLNRRDFGVGQGRWASDEWVKYPVKVSFEIYAAPPK